MPQSSLLAFSWQPKLTARQSDVNALHYSKLFSRLPRVDALLVGGGTILTDWQLSFPFFLLLIGAIIWAKFLGKKVVLYAVGAEPFSTKFGKIIAQAIFKRVDLITVRGFRSKNFLEMLNLDKPVCVTADPALFLQPESSLKVDKVLKKEKGEPENLRIAVCLRESNCKEGSKFRHFLADTLDYCTEKYNAEIIFLPISTSIYDDDRKIMIETSKMMKYRNKAKLFNERLTAQETMAVIKSANLVVSMRLHALIFAAATNTPSIALTGRVNYFVPPSNNKIAEFLERVNNEAWMCNYENAYPDDLKYKIEQKLSETKQQEEQLTPNLETLRAMCSHNAELVKELLK